CALQYGFEGVRVQESVGGPAGFFFRPAFFFQVGLILGEDDAATQALVKAASLLNPHLGQGRVAFPVTGPGPAAPPGGPECGSSWMGGEEIRPALPLFGSSAWGRVSEGVWAILLST